MLAAQFSINAKYEAGAVIPTGNVNFNCKSGNTMNAAGTFNFHFKSASFDWLVVSGTRIQIRGTGTINDGTTLHVFTLTAVDGGARNSGADRLRLQVTTLDGATLVFDNHSVVSSGLAVVLHRKGGWEARGGQGGIRALPLGCSQ